MFAFKHTLTSMNFRFVKSIVLICFVLLFHEGIARTHSDSLAADHLLSGRKYLSSSQYEAAFRELVTSRFLFMKSGNREGEVSVYMTFAKFYADNHIWTGAQLYYQKAFLASGGSSRAMIANKLSGVYNSSGKYDEAIRFNNYSIQYFKTTGDTGNLAESYIQSADIKSNLKKYNEAEKILLKTVLPLLRAAGNESGRIACFDVLGHMYQDQKKYSQAKWFFIQANIQSHNLKDTTGLLTSLINLAKVKTDIKDYDLAIGDLRQSDTLATKINTLYMLADTKKLLGAIYGKTGKKELSKKYTLEYQQLINSITALQKTVYTPVSDEEINKIIKANKNKAEPGVTKPWIMISVYFLSAIIVLIILLYIRRRNK